MIVVDTSAPVAIVLGEPQGRLCLDVLERETEAFISAGTLAELLIVASRLRISAQMNAFVDQLKFGIVNVTGATATAVGKAYQKWGRGFHPAGLNFGDCFAYVEASERNCPLLFVGGDFSKTDIVSAL